MLSAHFDSWDGGTGATDNGTGTITMLEAMRILKKAYPHPKRTILVGHWSGEEQGLIGSRAFAADHPEMVRDCRRCSTRTTAPARSRACRRTASSSGGVARAVDVAHARRHDARVTLMLPGVAHNESTDSDAFDCRTRRRSS